MTTAAEIIERQELVDELVATEEARKVWIKDQVLVHGRLDVLCEQVLGLTLKPFHKALQRFCLYNPESLQLAFRGGGKSTSITVAISIFRILRDPNIRILIASKTHNFAKDVLKEVKGHLETNEQLTDIFGVQRGDKWGESEIVVGGRTKILKESTVSTVGAEGQVVGKHYDCIFVDDLVDEKNSRTQYMRDQIRVFYYKTLMPTLEPGGELHLVGTRYHYGDLYGHLQRNEMKTCTQVIPVLNDKDQTPWPEKFTPTEVKKRKRAMGLAIFTTQMQCDADQMRGEVFEIDYMPEVDIAEVPSDAKIYVGVDVSTGEGADFFAMVALAMSGSKFWVLDFFERKIKFSDQVRKIVEWNDKYAPVKFGIESNAYQVVLAQTLQEKFPEVPVKRITTKLKKVERGIRLAARHEENEFFYVYGNQALISHLLLFPKGDNDDLFDALYFAYRAAVGKRKGKRRSRRQAPLGLL